MRLPSATGWHLPVGQLLRKAVIVTEAKLLHGHGVIFIYDRDDVRVEDPFDCIRGILPPHSAIDVIVRQQQLGDFDAVLFEGRAYMRISSGWPAAAQACFPGRSSGRWPRPNMWTPAAIAPADDDTGIPVLDEEVISDANRRNCLPSSARPPERGEDPRPKLDDDSSHGAVGR